MPRVATRSDAATLCELIAAFRDDLGTSEPRDAELQRSLPEVLEDERTEFCLALSTEGAGLGYTQSRFFPSVWAPGGEAHLEDLFVVASARRAGVGKELLGFALERARARGVRRIGLQTNENNDAAHGLYEQAGFRARTEARWQGGREVHWSRRL